MTPSLDIARITSDRAFGFANGGWNYDAYPDLEPLRAGRTITVARIEGPAVIRCLHSTQHPVFRAAILEDERRSTAARGVVLEIFFDGEARPAVSAPLGDLFADGLGRAEPFSSFFIEKLPDSYNLFLPMPFARSARVTLRNDTPWDLLNYCFVEYERLPRWEPDLGYLHAAWKRFAFQLHGETDQPFFRIEGRGHLVGRAWTLATNEPAFDNFAFVMEGNNEFRVDGESEPRADYLGTEDSFGFAWGFQRVFTGLRSGITFHQAKNPSLLGIYRFLDSNAIRFEKSLDLRVDWTHELKHDLPLQQRLREFQRGGERGWIDFATTTWWYGDRPGGDADPLPPLEERKKVLLAANVHRHPLLGPPPAEGGHHHLRTK